MIRKLAIIALLAIGLGALLYFQPWQKEEQVPRFYDRLPEADIIGRTDLLQLSQMLEPTLYFHKIAFRDFISPEFILSQGKGYGLDVQKPVFFFGNTDGESITNWGVLIHVRDSSKVREGIERIRKILPLRDSIFYDQRVYYNYRQQLTLAYGDNWMLLCNDSKKNNFINKVALAKFNSIQPRWRKFLNDNLHNTQQIIAEVVHGSLQKFGVEKLHLSALTDSTDLTIFTKFTQFDTLSITLKENGSQLPAEEFTKHLINAQLNIDRLRKNHEDPIYQFAKSKSAKISFPLDDFLEAWDGEVAFRQGGLQTITEEYIESEFDDDFNVTEVVKYKDVKVSGFALYLSMNENRDKFLTRLFDKGIITADGSKYRLLYSPPLSLKRTDSSLVLHTSRYTPKLEPSHSNSGMWMIDYTPVFFSIDSTHTRDLYGHIKLPLQRIISKNIPSPTP